MKESKFTEKQSYRYLLHSVSLASKPISEHVLRNAGHWAPLRKQKIENEVGIPLLRYSSHKKCSILSLSLILDFLRKLVPVSDRNRTEHYASRLFFDSHEDSTFHITYSTWITSGNWCIIYIEHLGKISLPRIKPLTLLAFVSASVMVWFSPCLLYIIWNDPWRLILNCTAVLPCNSQICYEIRQHLLRFGLFYVK